MSVVKIIGGWRQRLTVRKVLGLLWVAVPIAAIVYGWPGTFDPIEFPDSRAYKEWPAEYRIGPQPFSPEIEPDKLRVMGRRPPVYPLFLDVFGTGPFLVQVQTILSVFSWAWLGWCVARGPGVVVGSIFSLLPAMWGWNRVVLTESLSFSIVALVFAATLMLMRRWTWPRFAWWALCLAAFGFSRDTNLFGIPFLLIPALTTTWKRAGLVVLTGSAIFAIGYLDSKANDRDRWPLLNAIAVRVLTNPDATAEFMEAGMPMSLTVAATAGMTAQYIVVPYEQHAPDYLEWFDTKGVFTYQKYLLSHPLRTFPEAQDILIENIRYYPAMYFFRVMVPVKILDLERLYYPLPAPLLWWSIVLLPLLEFGVRRTVDPLAWLAAVLPLFTFFQVFVCYHGDGMEVQRHIMVSIVTYRVSALVSLAAVVLVLYRIVQMAVRGRRAPATVESVPNAI